MLTEAVGALELEACAGVGAGEGIATAAAAGEFAVETLETTGAGVLAAAAPEVAALAGAPTEAGLAAGVGARAAGMTGASARLVLEANAEMTNPMSFMFKRILSSAIWSRGHLYILFPVA